MFKEFRSILPNLVRHRWSYLLGLLFLLATNSGQLFIPQVVKVVIDDLAQNQGTRSLVLQLVTLAALAIGIALGRIGWRYFIIGTSRKIETELRQRLFDHVLTLGPRFFGNNRTGDLMARATNDMDSVRMATGMAWVALTDFIFLTTSILIILFSWNPFLGLMVVLPLPVITLLILLLGKKVRKLFTAVQEGYSGLSTHAQETFQGIRVVKAFVQEDNWTAGFARKNDLYMESNLKLVRLWGLFFPVIGFLSGSTTVILLLVGGPLVISGQFSPGSFTAFLTYLAMLIWPITSIGMVINMLQRGQASLARINAILETKPEIVPPPQPTLPQGHRLDISGLDFSYADGAKPVLRDLNLTIPEGTFLGILGRFGSGKSTLLHLLPRLLDPPPGTIRLGGQDIRDLDPQVLRAHFSLVTQNSFLFSDTIANNLRFGAPELSEQELQELARLTAIEHDVKALKDGFATEIGERGISLSGGQKQRLALARALASPAPVLLLDDALSAVDLKTEETILEHLQEATAGRTCLMVSHRTSTLSRCDRVIVLEKGKIVQDGTPAALLEQEGIFAEIDRLQKMTRKEAP